MGGHNVHAVEPRRRERMRLKSPILAIALVLTSLALTSPATHAQAVDPAPAKFRAIKIVLVGDLRPRSLGGWGPSFCGWHVTSFAACINLARGGRSSGNYRAEGSWALAMDEIKSGGFTDTYVLIQFGHNDQPGKPGRSTDLATEFPANMKRYVEEVRAAGGKPILVTPLTRRQFKDGKLIDDLGPRQADAVRKVAAESNTPLVDLYACSRGRGPGHGSRRGHEVRPAPAIGRGGRGGDQDRHNHRRQYRRPGRARRVGPNRAEQRRHRAHGPSQAVV
ncbi:rhamnogalacturonan acetylesterase [Caulobacter segnis]